MSDPNLPTSDDSGEMAPEVPVTAELPPAPPALLASAPGYAPPAGAPAPGYTPPASGYMPPVGAPAPGYTPPASGYMPPVGAPAPGYTPPAPGYTPPAMPGYQAPPPGYTPAPGYVPPAGYAAPGPAKLAPVLSIISVVAGGIGIFGVVAFIFSIAAIVLGFIGKAKEPSAKGLWLTGIILGFVGILIGIVTVAGFFIKLAMLAILSSYR